MTIEWLTLGFLGVAGIVQSVALVLATRGLGRRIVELQNKVYDRVPWDSHRHLGDQVVRNRDDFDALLAHLDMMVERPRSTPRIVSPRVVRKQ